MERFTWKIKNKSLSMLNSDSWKAARKYRYIRERLSQHAWLIPGGGKRGVVDHPLNLWVDGKLCLQPGCEDPVNCDQGNKAEGRSSVCLLTIRFPLHCMVSSPGAFLTHTRLHELPLKALSWCVQCQYFHLTKVVSVRLPHRRVGFQSRGLSFWQENSAWHTAGAL